MEQNASVRDLLGESFVPSEVENPATDIYFEPLEAGWYPAKTTSWEVKEVKDENDNVIGKMLVIHMETIGTDEGSPNGRRVRDNLNLVNRHDGTVAIAKKRLAALCLACDIETGKEVNSFDELLNHDVLVNVNVKKSVDKKTGKEYINNDPTAYKHISEYYNVFSKNALKKEPEKPKESVHPATAAAPAAQAAQASAPASGGTKPWLRPPQQ